MKPRMPATIVRGQAEVALHVVAAQVEVAVAKPRQLVHPVLVELERQRLAARDDLERVDLELDLAGREIRVDRVGRAADELALGAEHELVAHLRARPRPPRARAPG